MEDVLGVYTRPRDPDCPLVCLDETSKQLLAETRGPIPMKQTGRSFSLDDVDTVDEEMPDIDDIATSKPSDDVDKDEE